MADLDAALETGTLDMKFMTTVEDLDEAGLLWEFAVGLVAELDAVLETGTLVMELMTTMEDLDEAGYVLVSWELTTMVEYSVVCSVRVEVRSPLVETTGVDMREEAELFIPEV